MSENHPTAAAATRGELRCPECKHYLLWTAHHGRTGWYCPGCWTQQEVVEVEGRYQLAAKESCRTTDDIAVAKPTVFSELHAEIKSIREDLQSAVDHPEHYGGEASPYEAIKVIEAWGLGFCLGNALKYLSRAGKKPGASELEDLRKARWYLDREIGRLSSAKPNS